MLVDGKHFLIGEQREREGIDGGKIAAHHQRGTENRPQGHQSNLFVVGQAAEPRAVFESAKAQQAEG